MTTTHRAGRALEPAAAGRSSPAVPSFDELLSVELATRVVRRALKTGGDFAEVYAEERVSQAISTDGGRIERVTSGVQRGAGIRVAAGESVGLAFTESLDPPALLGAADSARTAASGSSSSAPGRVVPSRGAGAGWSTAAFVAASRVERAALVMRGDRAAWACDPRIHQVTVFLGTIQQRIVVANSEGRYRVDWRPRLRYRVQVVARGSRAQVGVGTYAPGVTDGFDFLERVSPETIARRAVDQALAQLEAGPAPAGTMPVVLGAGVGGVLVHEACGHGLEADAVLRGGSIFAGRIGQTVASRDLVIVDDGTLPGAWGTYRMDDEGEPPHRSGLIEGGRLQGYLHDARSAILMKTGSTGNGRRASFRHLPLPRMTNTFILPGATPAREIISDTPYGLYAKSLSAGQVNPTSGIFLFTVREGYLIRNGRLDHPVIGATVAGQALQALEHIDGIGDDLEVVAGNCAREGQRVFVGIGQPTIRISGLLVGGTSPAKWSRTAAQLGSSRAWRGLEADVAGTAGPDRRDE